MKTFTYYSAARNRSQAFQGDNLTVDGTVVTILLKGAVASYINLAPGDYIVTLQPSTAE